MKSRRASSIDAGRHGATPDDSREDRRRGDNNTAEFSGGGRVGPLRIHGEQLPRTQQAVIASNRQWRAAGGVDVALHLWKHEGHQPDQRPPPHRGGVFGGQPLARVIQKEVRVVLTDQILFGALEQGGTASIDVTDNHLTFSYESTAKSA